MTIMDVAAIEVLLLDTLEKEGEDNKLIHVCEGGSVARSRWSELRGVFAAAMGTMKSVVGEPLVAAHFCAGADATCPTLVAFVDLNEVLFVMVFVECTLPQNIIQYFTRSSCELLVSLLGYPYQKLSEWRAELSGAQLEAKVQRICRGVFDCIRRDVRWETHVQFAFDGCVPAVTYPLDTLARLSAFQVIEPVSDVYEVMGFALFYKNMLVVAKTTPENLKLFSQWFLHDDFNSEADSGNGYSLLLFKWFDGHYAMYGVFPPIHSLVRIRHGDIHCFYLLRHTDEKAFEIFKHDPSALISTEDLAELLEFADARLQQHYDLLLLSRRKEIAPNKPFWYSVVIDKARHILHGFKPSELFAASADSSIQDCDPFVWRPLLELLVEQLSTVFQIQRTFPPEAHTQTSDSAPLTRKRWIPRVKLDFDNRGGLLILPVRPEDDAGADISSEEAQIFPPVYHQLESDAIESLRKHPGGELQQEAERLCLDDDRLVWVVANYYEIFDLFGVCDADCIPMERLEQEMDTLLKIE